MRVVFTRSTATRLFLMTLIVGALTASLIISSKRVTHHSAALAALDESSYVVLLRHGDAPGRKEPLGFDLHDCSTQRNLSDKGRNEARELGELLRERAINVTKVLTSRWCRTHETAELLKLGPVENEPAFDNLEFNKNRAADLLDGERERIASWHGPGVLLVVTHSSNIKALTGLEIEQGAMIVASPTTASSTFRFSKILLKDIFT